MKSNVELKVIRTEGEYWTSTDRNRVMQASNAKKAGRSHLMIAQNPVYIFTAQGGAKE